MREIPKNIDKNQDGKLDLKELKALQENLKNPKFKEKIFKKMGEAGFLNLLKKQRKELSNPDTKKIVNDIISGIEAKQLKQVKDFFTVNGETLKDFDSKLLEEFGQLDIVKLLKGYMDYINENLKNLSKEEIDKVKLSIIRRFNNFDIDNFLKEKKKEILEEIEEVKKEKKRLEEELKEAEKEHKKHPNTLTLAKIRNIKTKLKYLHIPKLKDYRWIVNEELIEKFSFVNDRLLPSLAFYSKYKNRIEKGARFGIYTNKKIEEIKELLKADVDKKGNFDEGIFSTQDIFDVNDKSDKTILGSYILYQSAKKLKNKKRHS